MRLTEDESALWYCQNCFNNAVPFSAISDENMKLTYQGKNLIINKILDPSENLNKQFFDDIKNSSLENSLEIENPCPYNTLSDINQRNQNQNSLNIFHLNIASLNLHQDELKVLLENCNSKLNFIGISETGYKNNNATVTIDGFNHSDCFTESKRGGVRLYISSELSFIEKTDIKLYKKNEVESIFVEVIQESGKNVIVGCTYKHPSMDISQFNNLYSDLLENLMKINKLLSWVISTLIL